MKINTVALAAMAITAAVALPHGNDEHPDHQALDKPSIQVDDHREHDDHDHDHDHDDGHELHNTTSHNHTDHDMEPSPAKMGAGHHHHGKSVLDDPTLEPQQRAYWEQYNTTTFLTADAPAKPFLYGHMIFNFVAWVGIFPLALVLGAERSALHLPMQTVHSAMVLVALMLLGIYNASAPDLYPNNVYSKMSVFMFFLIVVHWVAAAVKTLAGWAINATRYGPLDGVAEYVLAQDQRPSQDSGHYDSRPESPALGNAQLRQDIVNRSSDECDDDADDDEEKDDMYLYGGEEDEEAGDNRQHPFEVRMQDRLISRVMLNKTVSTLVTRLGSIGSAIFTLTDRPMFFIGFAYLLIGIATVTCMAQGKKVFNILAHFIKGGVFFLYGLLTLARYLGAFADQGMAWNLRPSVYLQDKSANIVQRVLRRISLPSMEFVESGLIFIYGTSNVFLEHLSNPGGEWSHMDLQHASIAFMYIGGGLCGLLVESSRVQQLLTRFTSSKDKDIRLHNPFPAFTVFCTGMLMSQHEQALPLSSQIHAQWGVLLCVAAIFRLCTYSLLLLSPISTTQPSRPFTELLVAFCLICGGMVFMQSNAQTVEALIYRGLDSMFMLNVNVGIAALIMAWEMLVMTVKGLAHSRS